MPSEARTRVLQVSNVSPIASREQVYQLFSFLGKVDEIKVYPQETNPMYASMTQKLAYIRFDNSDSVFAAQHMTNTVFIDRALICVPVPENKIPDEDVALKTGGPSWPGQRQLPPNVLNQIQNMGDQQVVVTIDPTLSALGLPAYPSLPANTDAAKIEEIRRTIYVGNIPKDVKSEETMQFFNEMIGEVMYLRMAGSENLSSRYAYIEFSNQSSVPTALQNNGVEFNGNRLVVQHSRVAIIKPQAKTEDMAKREIQEALKKQQTVGLNMPGSLTTSAMNLGLKTSGSVPHLHGSRSRSRSPGFYRSRSSYRRSRSRSPDRRWSRGRDSFRSRHDRDRRDRSREREREREREKERERRREKDKDKDRDRKKSRDKSRERRKRTPERESRKKSPGESSSSRKRDKLSSKDKEREREKDKDKDRDSKRSEEKRGSRSDRDRDKDRESRREERRRSEKSSKTEVKREEGETEEEKREKEMKEVDDILEEALGVGGKKVKEEPLEQQPHGPHDTEEAQKEEKEKTEEKGKGKTEGSGEDEEEMPATEILTRMKPKYARRREGTHSDSDKDKKSSSKRSKKESKRKRKSSSSEEEERKPREKKRRKKDTKKKKKRARKESDSDSSSSSGSD